MLVILPTLRIGLYRYEQGLGLSLRQRGLLILAIAAIHVGLVSLLILSSRSIGQAPPSRIALAAFDIAATPPTPDAPAAPAPKAPVPSERLELMLPSLSELTVAPPVGGTGTGQGCAMGAKVMAAITADPLAMQALAELPPEARSEADAVMLWNGDWFGAAAPAPPSFFDIFDPEPNGPVEVLKAVVVKTVTESSPECQMATLTGPQLIPIPEQDRTTMLVIGSGVWAWASLLAPPPSLAEPVLPQMRG